MEEARVVEPRGGVLMLADPPPDGGDPSVESVASRCLPMVARAEEVKQRTYSVLDGVLATICLGGSLLILGTAIGGPVGVAIITIDLAAIFLSLHLAVSENE